MMKDEIAITAYKCNKCGRVHYPFHDRCLDCRSRQFTQMKPKGTAKLLTYTMVTNLPWGFDTRFMLFGVVEFENGIRAMGQIKADSIDELEMGMNLKAGWEPIRVTAGEEVYGLMLSL